MKEQSLGLVCVPVATARGSVPRHGWASAPHREPTENEGSDCVWVLVTASPKLIPLEGQLRDCGVGVGAVVDGFDNELHPLCLYRSNINFLAVHPVGEG